MQHFKKKTTKNKTGGESFECPQAGEPINNGCFVHIMESYFVIKKKETCAQDDGRSLFISRHLEAEVVRDQ